jgi:hypothetical protein
MAREAARRIRVAGLNQKRPFCYVTFFRFDDLVAIPWQCIKFIGQSHMELFVPGSKTDQYHTGKTILVARLGGPFCPVALVQRILDVGQYGLYGHGPLIRSVLICPPLQRIKENSPCYDTVLSWCKLRLQF